MSPSTSAVPDRADARVHRNRWVGLPAPVRFSIAVAASYVATGAAMRLLLWVQFGLPGGVSPFEMPRVLAFGFLNDTFELAYLLLPLSAFLALLPENGSGRRSRAVLLGALAAVLFGMLFLGALEYFFFEEFDARFNLVAVDYLIYPTEVIGNIHDSYPVGSLSALLAVIALAAASAQWPWVRPRADECSRRRTRLWILLGNAALAGLIGTTVRADFGSVAGHRIANELAANGPSSFFSALRTNHLEYPAFYRTGDPATLLSLLRDDLARGGGGGSFVPGASGITRSFPARFGLGQMNVVVLAEESFGAEFVGAYGDARGLTPEFDALAAEGLLFTHAYATGTRTVRGLEAISASFPPIPSESILKRPGYDNIATWGGVLARQGYHTSFLYGGYGTFDNMNAYFAANGYAVHDRKEIPSPRFANIWGVSDEDLFAHAIAYFDAQARAGAPFFSIVMSTSNHKPFTFREGVPGVKPEGGGRESGIRYADHALGEFFRAARSRPWFKDTLFVVVADHGARVYGAADVPLFSYEIPLLILAPGHITPGRVDTPTSHIDLAPTVLGMLGLPYEAPFLGQDVLRWKGGDRVLLFNHNHDVALLRGSHLAILGLHGTVSCERYERSAGAAHREHDRFATETCDPSLVDLATAYYQSGYDLFTAHAYR